MKEALKEGVMQALRRVQDPEMMLGIVDLGLIYDVDVDDAGEAKIKMTLTTPACPYGDVLVTKAQQAAEKVEGITKAEMIVVWNPPWDPKEMCSDLAKDKLGIW
ncbi:MAG: hypothetical protein DRP45_01895 [Candidatus Zixiibacteriota bacterium]|nr:MAG: hypothetical protein DRP45_01895 [candidate division Zixibacteria bacterium]